MPKFNFKPIVLEDGTKCIGCPHFDIHPLGDQECKVIQKFSNRIYYKGLNHETWEFYEVGEKFKRPIWCPLVEVKE